MSEANSKYALRIRNALLILNARLTVCENSIDMSLPDNILKAQSAYGARALGNSEPYYTLRDRQADAWRDVERSFEALSGTLEYHKDRDVFVHMAQAYQIFTSTLRYEKLRVKIELKANGLW